MGFEMSPPILIAASLVLSLSGTAAFCVFERLINTVRPVLVVCASDSEGIGVEVAGDAARASDDARTAGSAV